MQRLILVALSAAGCFDPRPPQGLACGMKFSCPPGQSCFDNGTPDGVCLIPADAGTHRDAGASETPDASPQPDLDASTADAGVCSLVPNEGCGSAACRARCDGTTFETYCSGSNAAGTSGIACGNDANCAVGYDCIGGPGYSRCRKLCLSTSACEGAGSVCRGIDCGGTVQDAFRACTESCDPISQSGCPAGTACGVSVEGTVHYSYCRSADTGTTGSACASVLDCAPGYTCTSPSNVCRRYCIVGGGGICSGAETCNEFTSGPIIKGIEYGFCQ